MKRRLFLLLLGMMLVSALAGTAQDRKKEPPLRTVRGQVVDKDNKPLPTAIIYLKNLSNKNETTHIADDEGNYRFTGLDPNVDYEIHAEHQGKSSAKRTISTFESRKEIILQLKVDRK
jgi:protocatechuate 3,4-dioxygenase beta subunit